MDEDDDEGRAAERRVFGAEEQQRAERKTHTATVNSVFLGPLEIMVGLYSSII